MLTKLSSLIHNGFLAIFFAVAIFACKNTIQEVEELSNTDIPNSIAKNFVLKVSDSAKIKFRISAPEVITQFKGKVECLREFPKGIVVLSYDDMGEQTSDLRADYAIHYVDSNLWKAQKNVIVVSNDGKKITTEEAYWDRTKELIYTDVDVAIDNEGSLIYGKGMLTNQNFDPIAIYQTSGTLGFRTVLIDKANFSPDSTAASETALKDNPIVAEPILTPQKNKNNNHKKLIKYEQ